LLSPSIGRRENEFVLRIEEISIRRSGCYACIPLDWRTEGFAIVIKQGVITIPSVGRDYYITDCIMTEDPTVLSITIKRRFGIVNDLRPDRAPGQDYTNE
jgi:hypothetical protein